MKGEWRMVKRISVIFCLVCVLTFNGVCLAKTKKEDPPQKADDVVVNFVTTEPKFTTGVDIENNEAVKEEVKNSTFLHDGINVVTNGRVIDFDVYPQIIGNRVMVPLRKIFEELGADVFWDGETRKITAILGSNTIVTILGDKNAYVNGELVVLDIPPLTIKDRTLVPIRFVSESFGANVEWDDVNRIVFITLE